MSASQENSGWRLLAPRIVAVFLLLVGLFLGGGGAYLLSLGGSPYYVITGIACLASAWFLWRGSMWGVWIYAAMMVWTLIWAFWEAGFDAWALMPRIAGPLVIAIIIALPFVWRPLAPARMPGAKV